MCITDWLVCLADGCLDGCCCCYKLAVNMHTWIKFYLLGKIVFIKEPRAIF